MSPAGSISMRIMLLGGETGSAAVSLLSALEFSADDGIHDLDEVGQPIRDFDIVASEFQYVCVIS